MAKHKSQDHPAQDHPQDHPATHKRDSKPVAPKAPVLVSPPRVSPPGGGTAQDQSGLKWYQKKIMGVPMWVFLGIAGAIAAYFLYEYISGGSTAASTAVPSSASTDPTDGTTAAGTDTGTSGGSAGGGGIVDPISGNSGVGNAAPTVTGAPAPTTTTTPTIVPTPNASQANNPANADVNLGGSTTTNLYPGQKGSGPSPGSTAQVDNRVTAAHVQVAHTTKTTVASKTADYVGARFGPIVTAAPKPAPAKLPPEKKMIAQSKIKTAPKASPAKEAAGKALTISHAQTRR